MLKGHDGHKMGDAASAVGGNRNWSGNVSYVWSMLLWFLPY